MSDKMYDTPARLAAAKDRGEADAYYKRNNTPHLWTGTMPATRDDDLSPREVKAYVEGNRKGWETGAHKDWE